MGLIRNFFIFWISVLILISTVLLIVGFSLNALLYPDVYKESFEKREVYGFFEEQIENTSEGNFIKIPEEGSNVLVDKFLEDFLAYVRSDTEEFRLVLEIDNESIQQFFLERAEEFPVCEEGQESYLNGELVCRPSNVDPEEFLNEVLEGENLTFLQEGEVDLTQEFLPQDGSLQKLREVVQFYQTSKFILVGALAILLFFLYLFEGELKFELRTAGVDFMIAGVAAMAIGFFAGIFIPDFTTIADLGEFSFLGSVVNDLVDAVFSRINTFSIVILIIGSVLFIASFKIKSKKAKAKAKANNEQSPTK